MQVRPRGGEPAPPLDVAVERGEPLLAVAVHVRGQLIAGLLDGLEEGTEQGARRRTALQDQRPGVPAELVVRRGREAVLHPLEVGKAVRVVPGLHPRIGGPSFGPALVMG